MTSFFCYEKIFAKEKFANLQNCKIFFLAWIRQDKCFHLTYIKARLFIVIAKKVILDLLRSTCLASKLTKIDYEWRLRDFRFNCSIYLENFQWRHQLFWQNQNKQRSEILSELHLVVSDCTIPCFILQVHYQSPFFSIHLLKKAFGCHLGWKMVRCFFFKSSTYESQTLERPMKNSMQLFEEVCS